MMKFITAPRLSVLDMAWLAMVLEVFSRGHLIPAIVLCVYCAFLSGRIERQYHPGAGQ